MKPLREIRVPVWLVLAIGTLAYCYFYLSYPALPGNNLEYPRGWWGWFDQGEYLKAATAFTVYDFSPAKHAYPPLYPAIGSLFMSVMPVHPFFFFDLISLLTFSAVFIAFAKRFVSEIEAAGLLILTLFLNKIAIVNFSIPWTTTGTALIYAITIHQLLRKSEQLENFGSLAKESAKAFFFSGIFGLLVILRPVDAGAAAVFFPAYLYLSWKALRNVGSAKRNTLLAAQTVALGAGLMIGLTLFFLFNYELYGSILGGYFKSTASASGYFPLELARKTFSLVFDSNTVFLEPKGSLVTHFPWLVLSIIGIFSSLVRGPFLLRVMAAAICLQFCLYAPYGDLLPNGVYRYLNIHYFKWMFPYLGFFAWIAVRWTFSEVSTASRMRSIALRSSVLAIAVLAIFSPQFKTKAASEITVSSVDAQHRISFAANGDGIDFIDFRGLAGGFNEIYLGQHELLADGKPMNRVKDFRLLPAPWGVRMFFNRRVRVKEFVLTPDKGLNFAPDGLKLTASTYRFAVGIPKLVHDAPSANY